MSSRILPARKHPPHKELHGARKAVRNSTNLSNYDNGLPTNYPHLSFDITQNDGGHINAKIIGYR